MAERSEGRMKRLGEDGEMEWRLEVEVEVEGADAEVEVEVWKICVRGVHMIIKGISVDISTHVHVGVPWVFYSPLYRNKVSLMIAETGLHVGARYPQMWPCTP